MRDKEREMDQLRIDAGSVRVAVNGCGRVGKALLRHWGAQESDVQVVLLRRSNGQWRTDEGALPKDLPSLENMDYLKEPLQILDQIVKECPIDVWFELTPTDLGAAKAVHERIMKILEKGISVVLANKAPVLHDYTSLKKAADRHGAVLGLSAVMGASLPSYALGHYGAMGSRILSMQGILNGTTNFMLANMEAGDSFDKALAEALADGIAEPNWAYDVDGVDSGVKMAILASVLCDRNVPLDLKRVRGIRDITPQAMAKARTRNERFRLVASWQDGQVSVEPRRYAIDELFYHVTGSNKILQIKTDTLSEMSVLGGKSGLREVAASMHRDMLWMIAK